MRICIRRRRQGQCDCLSRMVAVVIECKLQKTIRRSKSHHHLHVSKLDRRKVNFKVLRQCHFTCWSHNRLRVGQWLNHRHDVCCCTLSNKGPLAMAGKAQNTVRTLYSLWQHGPTHACTEFMSLLFWGEQFQTRLAGFEEDDGEIVQQHLRNLQPCCASMLGNTKRLCICTDHCIMSN